MSVTFEHKKNGINTENEMKRRIAEIRRDFPILNRKVNDKPLVYLDNGASTQMPKQVIDTISAYHTYHHSNVHRGVHTLSQESTDLYEEARETLKKYINASSTKEIIFTSGTTDSINLVMHSYAKKFLKKGDKILVSNMEHHANIVPWYMLSKSHDVEIVVIPITDSGELDLDTFHDLLDDDVKIVAVNHVSNALGTINPIEKITETCRERGIITVVDGAQACAHLTVDVQTLGCDFYAFSGHKMHGPTGTGLLYGRKELLDVMDPYRGGGDMILSVSFDEIIYNEAPFKFEAGTPAIAQVIGMGAAAKYINEQDKKFIHSYEQKLLEYATDKVSDVPGLKIIGTAENKISLISFIIDGVHPHDIGTILDEEAVAVRTGHHCAQPVMQRYGIPATTRASMSFYNTFEEIDALVLALKKVTDLFDVN